MRCIVDAALPNLGLGCLECLVDQVEINLSSGTILAQSMGIDFALDFHFTMEMENGPGNRNRNGSGKQLICKGAEMEGDESLVRVVRVPSTVCRTFHRPKSKASGGSGDRNRRQGLTKADAQEKKGRGCEGQRWDFGLVPENLMRAGVIFQGRTRFSTRSPSHSQRHGMPVCGM